METGRQAANLLANHTGLLQEVVLDVSANGVALEVEQNVHVLHT